MGAGNLPMMGDVEVAVVQGRALFGSPKFAMEMCFVRARLYDVDLGSKTTQLSSPRHLRQAAQIDEAFQFWQALIKAGHGMHET